MVRRGFTSGDTAEAGENAAQMGELEDRENLLEGSGSCTSMRRFEVVPENPRAFARLDHVRVPDGRIGEVVGFYRRDDEPVMLVVFCSGATDRYRRADLRLVS